MTEKVNPEAMQIALLEGIQKSMLSMNKCIQKTQTELVGIRQNQERNTIHLKYTIDLSVAHTNKEIADFPEMGIDMNSIMIMPVPSTMSIRLRGLSDELIDLDIRESLSLNNHKITRLFVTNVVGAGTAEIHVFGRPEVKLWVEK